MTSRREFLQTTAIVATVPIAVRSGFADLAPPDRLVVFDRGLPAARRFGARMERADWSVRGIEDDVTPLWVGELSRRWSDRPFPVAGLTARPALFCLEQLAWDHRMRVVYHAEHEPWPNGETAHSVQIAAGGLGVSEFRRAGRRWPEYLADALTDVPVEGLDAHGPSEASVAAPGDDETILHSWVIAPVLSRARAVLATDS